MKVQRCKEASPSGRRRWKCASVAGLYWRVADEADGAECSASVESVSGRKRKARERMKPTMMNLVMMCEDVEVGEDVDEVQDGSFAWP